MRHLTAAWLAALAMLACFAAPAWADPTFPKLTGRVVDVANVIPDDVEARLTQKLSALETQSHRQLVIATLPNLQGYEISDYGYQLGRAWGIGSKDKNNGALLIVAPKERKVRIEVGYGLEGVLTDGMSSLIINQTIVPKFKEGDMPGGIEAGADAIIHQLTLPAQEAQKLAAAANKQPEQGGGLPVFFILFFLFFFVLPILRSLFGGSRGRRYNSGGFAPVIWGSGGGSSSSGWSGGGGGFSGGGGSFGGGGSSGSW